MKEWKVAVLSMMVTLETYLQCEQHLGCGCERRLHGKETRPYNCNETGGSITEWKVAVWLMMETSTSASSHPRLQL
jgi:hypothetical protein